MSDQKEQKRPPQKAVALSYDGLQAPTVSAKGEEELAEEIIKIAQEYNIPICENPELVKLLLMLDLGHEIPRELYIAVASIIALVYNLEGKSPRNHGANTTNRTGYE